LGCPKIEFLGEIEEDSEEFLEPPFLIFQSPAVKG
jgi:hypothetical protein